MRQQEDNVPAHRGASAGKNVLKASEGSLSGKVCVCAKSHSLCLFCPCEERTLNTTQSHLFKSLAAKSLLRNQSRTSRISAGKSPASLLTADRTHFGKDHFKHFLNQKPIISKLTFYTHYSQLAIQIRWIPQQPTLPSTAS